MGKVNCLELYRSYGLPLEEAYWLAGFKYFYTDSAANLSVLEALQNEICRLNNRAPNSFEDAAAYCRRFMKNCGYIEWPIEGVYLPECNIDGNAEKPEDQRIRNTFDYYDLYKKGAVCLADAYVLAKNKNFLLCDDDMLYMLFTLEDIIMEECNFKEFFDGMREESGEPRKQISSNTMPTSPIIEQYMLKHGYIYDRDRTNSFRPIKQSGFNSVE